MVQFQSASLPAASEIGGDHDKKLLGFARS
jgi:hypothetical protein